MSAQMLSNKSRKNVVQPTISDDDTEEDDNVADPDNTYPITRAFQAKVTLIPL